MSLTADNSCKQADGQRPLAVLGAYAPSILYGASEWRPILDDGPWAHHHLPSYAFLSVHEGVHTYKTDQAQIRLHAGDVVLLTPDVLYRHRLAPHGRIRYVAFNVIAETLESRPPSNSLWPLDFDHAQPSCRQVWGHELPTRLPDELLGRAVRDVADMCHLWWRGDQQRLQANHLLTNILFDLNRHVVRHQQTPSVSWQAEDLLQATVDTSDTFLVSALRALDGRLPPQSVSDWAAQLGLSRAYFTRQFTQLAKQSAGAFLRRLRLRRAADLLSETDNAIDYIAWESGYRSVSALDHAFKAAYGCAPGAWRRGQRAS